MKDYDDIEILELKNKKKPIPSDKTEVLDPVVVKKVMNKKAIDNRPNELASRVELREKKEQEEPESTKKEKPKKEKKVKGVKEKKPAKTWEKVFWAISIAFILGCCIFYGKRLIHYYKIYNPTDASGKKVLLLGDQITTKSEIVYEESGLYNPNPNEYVYKGNVTNNYVKYNNLLWRIIKINPDGTMLVILDDSMTMLPWNNKATEYKNSDIHKYLNNDFLNNLDKTYLVKNTFCEDSVEELSVIRWEK